jgi:hypothetical protein
MTTAWTGRNASRRASNSPYAQAQTANGQATQRGTCDANAASGASTAIPSIAAISQRDGRSSKRQGTDALDQGM